MSVKKSNSFGEFGFNERISKEKLYSWKFEEKCIAVLTYQTNLSNITEEIKDFYRSIVMLEVDCIEDSENMGYSFPLKVTVSEDNNIVVKCFACGKEYNLKDAEKLIKEKDEFLNKVEKVTEPIDKLKFEKICINVLLKSENFDIDRSYDVIRNFRISKRGMTEKDFLNLVVDIYSICVTNNGSVNIFISQALENLEIYEPLTELNNLRNVSVTIVNSNDKIKPLETDILSSKIYTLLAELIRKGGN